MSLINYQGFPLHPFEQVYVALCSFIVGDENIKFPRLEDVGNEVGPLLFRVDKYLRAKLRKPLIYLSFPVMHHWFGTHYEVLPLYVVLLVEIGEEGNCLDGFAEAHVVSQNSIRTASRQSYHPIQSLQLIFLQLSTRQTFRLPHQIFLMRQIVINFVYISLDLFPHRSQQLLKPNQVLFWRIRVA